MNDILELSNSGTRLMNVLDESVIHLTIPEGVSSIAPRAFKQCPSLLSVDIPNTLKVDSGGLFSCKSLQTISVKEDNPRYASVDGILYSKDITKIILMPSGRDQKEFVIPDSVTEIGYSAISNCESIVSIKIPNSVNKIGPAAFKCCKSLTSIQLPGSIDNLKWSLFEDCSSLHTIDIPESVIEIDLSAFWGCISLKSITIHQHNKVYASIDGIIYSKDLSKIVLVPEGKDLSQFTVPENVKQIGGFSNCTSLQKIIIPNSVERIESWAFSGCSKLRMVSIPENVLKIDERTFYDCTSLCDIHLSNGIKSIEASAFEGCSSLLDVTIPNSMEYVDVSAFNGCDSLKTIDVRGENNYFSSIDGILYSKDLKSLVRIPTGIQTMHISIPERVKSIGDGAFEDCKFIQSVKIPDSITNIGDRSFANCCCLISVNLPNSLETIGKGAFSGCTSLTEVEIPNKVIAIGEFAFLGCI